MNYDGKKDRLISRVRIMRLKESNDLFKNILKRLGLNDKDLNDIELRENLNKASEKINSIEKNLKSLSQNNLTDLKKDNANLRKALQ